MSIEQKAREIATTARKQALMTDERLRFTARLGIIEGLEMAAKVARDLKLNWYPEDEIVGELTREKIAAAILALVEEQKVCP